MIETRYFIRKTKEISSSHQHKQSKVRPWPCGNLRPPRGVGESDNWLRNGALSGLKVLPPDRIATIGIPRCPGATLTCCKHGRPLPNHRVTVIWLSVNGPTLPAGCGRRPAVPGLRQILLQNRSRTLDRRKRYGPARRKHAGLINISGGCSYGNASFVPPHHQQPEKHT